MRLTVEELIAGCLVFGLPAPPGTEMSAFAALDPGQQQVAVAAALRSLIARDLVRPDSTTAPDEFVHTLVVTSQPRVRALFARETVDALEVRDYAAVPGGAVEHTWGASDIHQLEAFPTTELPARLFAFARLGDRTEELPGAVLTSAAVLAEAVQLAREGDRAGAQARLSGSSDNPSVVGRFADALCSAATTMELQIEMASDGGAPTRTVLVWLDGAEHGLWERILSPEEAQGSAEAAVPTEETAIEFHLTTSKDLELRIMGAIHAA